MQATLMSYIGDGGGRARYSTDTSKRSRATKRKSSELWSSQRPTEVRPGDMLAVVLRESSRH